MTNYYSVKRDPKTGVGIACVDLVESPDDGGWYAQEYNFLRRDNATRTSHRIYRDRAELVQALDTKMHKWKPWS